MNPHTKFSIIAIAAVIVVLIASLLNLAPAYGRDQVKYDAYRARRAVRMQIRRTRRLPQPATQVTIPAPVRVSWFRPMPLGMDRASWEAYRERVNNPDR